MLRLTRLDASWITAYTEVKIVTLLLLLLELCAIFSWIYIQLKKKMIKNWDEKIQIDLDIKTKRQMRHQLKIVSQIHFLFKYRSKRLWIRLVVCYNICHKLSKIKRYARNEFYTHSIGKIPPASSQQGLISEKKNSKLENNMRG